MFAKVNKPTMVFLMIGILFWKKMKRKREKEKRKDLICINSEMHWADGCFDNVDIKK